MAKRKTVKLTEVLDIANKMLDYDAEDCGFTPEEAIAHRRAVAALTEAILFRVESYAGYRHTSKAGVEFDDRGYAKSIADDTRRQYFVPYHCSASK
jgi:hypothetical protein